MRLIFMLLMPLSIFAQNRALLVSYPDASLYNLEDLGAMASYLANQDFIIHMTLQTEIEDIEHEYDKYFNQAHDTIIYYHTSHGISDQAEKEFYNALRQGKHVARKEEYYVDGLVNGVDTILYSELARMLGKLRYDYLLVIIDACYAGSIVPYIEKLPNTGWLLSSQANELSHTNCDISRWTQHLINSDDVFTLEKKKIEAQNPIIKY